jgi:class 3 adenylate cyclase
LQIQAGLSKARAQAPYRCRSRRHPRLGERPGDTVNIASLIERLADPGLVITKSVFDAVKNHIELTWSTWARRS